MRDPIEQLGDLHKAMVGKHKYISRKRGRDGKYEYVYPEGMGGMSDRRRQTTIASNMNDQAVLERAIRKNKSLRAISQNIPPAGSGVYIHGILVGRDHVKSAGKGSMSSGLKHFAKLGGAKDVIAAIRPFSPDYADAANRAHEEAHGVSSKDARKPINNDVHGVSSKDARKSEDKMEETREIKPELLSKGMHSFYDHDGKMKTVKEAWLADYVDAFLEEAYESERNERAHVDPNLTVQTADPTGTFARWVYNEFIAMCAHNKNLARAKDKLGVSVEFVEARLRAMNLMHVDSENHEANRQSAVAGYHPTPMALSQDGAARAELEQAEAKRRLGGLRKAEEGVRLAPGPSPFQALHKAQEERLAAQAGAFGQPPRITSKTNNQCPFHGRDVLKTGREISNIHGAVCLCG